ncbi:MAG: DUF4296 domain-containing protein [Bernardetiaceae bacterium]
MKRYMHILIALWVLATACQKEKRGNAASEGLLPPSVMIELLIDLHLAEEAAALKGRDFVDNEVLYAHYEHLLLQRYQIDTVILLKNLRHYLEDTKEGKKLYQAVHDSLEQRRQAPLMTTGLP